MSNDQTNKPTTHSPIALRLDFASLRVLFYGEKETDNISEEGTLIEHTGSEFLVVDTPNSNTMRLFEKSDVRSIELTKRKEEPKGKEKK